MSAINKTVANDLADRIAAAMETIAKDMGLTYTRGNGRYNANGYHTKVEFKAVANGTTGEPADFARNARLLGLPADCFGKTFVSRGTAYRISGLVLRRRRYPVSAERVSDSKGFKFAEATVKMLMGVAAPTTPTPIISVDHNDVLTPKLSVTDITTRVEKVRAAWTYKQSGTPHHLGPVFGGSFCTVFSTSKSVMASIQKKAAAQGLAVAIESSRRGQKSVRFFAA